MYFSIFVWLAISPTGEMMEREVYTVRDEREDYPHDATYSVRGTAELTGSLPMPNVINIYTHKQLTCHNNLLYLPFYLIVNIFFIPLPYQFATRENLVGFTKHFDLLNKWKNNDNEQYCEHITISFYYKHFAHSRLLLLSCVYQSACQLFLEV